MSGFVVHLIQPGSAVGDDRFFGPFKSEDAARGWADRFNARSIALALSHDIDPEDAVYALVEVVESGAATHAVEDCWRGGA